MSGEFSRMTSCFFTEEFDNLYPYSADGLTECSIKSLERSECKAAETADVKYTRIESVPSLWVGGAGATGGRVVVAVHRERVTAGARTTGRRRGRVMKEDPDCC